MKTFKYLVVIVLIQLSSPACTEEEPEILMPVITFDARDGIYRVNAGEDIILSPEVENSDRARYRWYIDEKVVGTEATYVFSSDVPGQFYVTFEVSNARYTVDKEVRVDVMPAQAPEVTFGIPEEGFKLLVRQEKVFSPVVTGSGEITCKWKIDGQVVSDQRELVYFPEETGDFAFLFTAGNMYGTTAIGFTVAVREGSDMQFDWHFERSEYTVQLGRSVILGPSSVENEFDAEYTWTLDETVLQVSADPYYRFEAERTGVYVLTVTMNNSYGSAGQQLTVTVHDNEDEYFRPSDNSSRPLAAKVWEYLPAPGQFINDGYTVSTMAEACAYAEGRFAEEGELSLGAFGGYVVVQFDHSVINDGGYNIQILGNSFADSSEPGIVWVMQDENGDGKPNDTWYELRGSESGKPETVQNYSVTYFKPDGPNKDVAWRDNLGNEGVVEYNRAFHSQDYYYPAWVNDLSYTLSGTRLEARTSELSFNVWYNAPFEWGYADNYSPVDRLTEEGNGQAGVNANHLRISNAVDAQGCPVNLKYIDFVKVQTGVQAQAGWMGEVSTEVFGIRDYNMLR